MRAARTALVASALLAFSCAARVAGVDDADADAVAPEAGVEAGIEAAVEAGVDVAARDASMSLDTGVDTARTDAAEDSPRTDVPADRDADGAVDAGPLDGGVDVPDDDTVDDADAGDEPVVDAAEDVLGADSDDVTVVDVADDLACPSSAPIRCGTECVGDTDSNPLHCGADCVVCATPTNGAPTCVTGACDIACDPGYVAVGGACQAIPAPRLVHPITNSRVSVRNPTLRWELPAGVDTAHVTVCPDRACSSVAVEFDASGSSAPVPVELPQGVWFWSAQSVDRGTRSAARSATWQLHTPAQSSPVEWAWAGRPDANGDGLDDIAVGGDGLLFLPGNVGASLEGREMRDPAAPYTGFFFRPQRVGDVNGDGFSDIGVDFHFDNMVGGLAWYAGSSTSLDALPVQSLGSPSGPVNVFPYDVDQSGDFDRDGYSDLFVTWYPLGASDGVYTVLRGGPTGWTRSGDMESVNALGISSATVLDFDADGYDDLLGMGYLSHALHWWRGSPSGLEPARMITTITGAYMPKVFAVGDVDGDSYPDAVLSTNDSSNSANGLRVTVIRGGPDGPGLGVPSQCGTTEFDVIGVTADLNGDGKFDLALGATVTPDVSFCLSTGTGFAPADTLPVTLESGCNHFTETTRFLGDWNGDGNDDFGTMCYGSNLYLFLGPYSGAPLVLPLPMDGSRSFRRFFSDARGTRSPATLRFV